MTALVLDSEGFSALARSRQGSPPGPVHAALRAAVESGSEVVVPAAVLAEQYRGGPHEQVVDSCLGRHTGIDVVNTDRRLARAVGHLLSRAGRGSERHVDATTVAVAVAAGGGVVLTADVDHLQELATDLVGVTVEGI